MTDLVLSTRPRFDVYQSVTARIVEAIEAGAGEFVMPWHGAHVADGRPTNPYTHCVYRGVNILALWAEAMLRGYQSRYWASYAQWRKVGGQVRKGEKGAIVVLYKQLDREPDELDLGPVTRWVARASKVFNANQVDGWVHWERAVRSDPLRISEEAEQLVSATKANIRHGADTACYIPPEDLILLPARERFVGSATSSPTDAYYATLFHELTHWSGAGHRLARDLSGRFGDQAYAAEELVAELGAAFLCADLEIANEPRADHAAYIGNWLTLLRGDARAVFAAALKARDAALYLQSFDPPPRVE